MTHPRRLLARAAVLLLTVLAAPLGPAHAAEAIAIPERTLALATCHARYTAARENSWLMGGEAEAMHFRREFLRAMMEAELATLPSPEGGKDAVTPGQGKQDPGRVLLSRRISVKSQFHSLLAAAQFAPDPRRKRMALAQVRNRLAACDSFLLAARFTGL